MYIRYECNTSFSNMRRSGTEVDYSELTQLLEDIAFHQRDIIAVLNKEKEGKKKKEMEDKQRGEEMRKH